MSAILLQNVTFGYPGAAQNIFENFSAVLDSDWKLALTGRNGRGKTTLLRLLSGEYEYKGKISVGAPTEYFPYAVDETLDALSALYVALPDIELWRLKAELNKLGVGEESLERPLCTLSGGERTKVLLAALFAKENAFPLIDEPTNHLDEAGRKKLSDYLAAKRGFILVSHDRDFLDGCCDHVLALNAEGYELRKGSFSDWWRDKAASDAAEAEKSARLQKQISALEASAARTSAWADKVEASKNQKVAGLHPDKGHIGAMAAKMAKRAKVTERRREQAAKEKRSLLKNAEFYGNFKLTPLPFRAQELCSLTHVDFAFGKRPAVRDLSLTVERGERIALKGENGCGKSTVLKLLTGELTAQSGIVRVPNDLRISYLPQNVSGICGTVAEYAAARGAEPSLVMAILNKFNLRSELFSRDISEYSDGQKKKVALAVSLATPAHLYIWDEPLNFIDLVSRIQLEELLLEYRPTLLFVEHDAAFRRNIATRTVELSRPQ